MKLSDYEPYFLKALRPTTAILKKNHPGVSPAGSGILIKVENDIFLVTASHLLHAFTWPDLTIPANDDSMINLHGRLLTSMPEGGNKLMDIAILKFNKNMHKYFPGKYDIVSISDIKFGFQPQPNSKLLLTGYPNSKVVQEDRKHFNAYPYKFATYHKGQRIYQKIGISKGCYIVTEYRKRVQNSNGEKIFAPDFEGISGSGLWIIEDSRVKLIGINTEYDKNQSYIISIRIDVVMHIIREKFKFHDSIPLPQVSCNVGDVHEIVFDGQVINE